VIYLARPKKQIRKKRTDGTFEAKVTIGYDVDGRAIRKSFYSSKSFEDAKEKGRRYIFEQELRIERGEAMPTHVLTFEKQALTVLELKKRKVKENTFMLSWHGVIVNHLIPYFKNTKLSTIKKNDIEKYFNSKSNYATATLRKHLNCLNEIFENAKDNGYLTLNPCDNFKISVGQNSQDKDVYTPEQAEKVLAFCKHHRFGLSIDLLLRYGVSRSELLGLKIEDVDFDKKIISIRRGVTMVSGKIVLGETKNKYRSRDIAVNDDTLSMIDKRCEFLIHNQDGSMCRPDTWKRRHYNVFMKDMQEFYRDENIPALSPHELRHTRATIWVNEGKNLFAIAEQMGWSDLDMLRKRYGHADIQLLRKELDL
jgi:integrase